VFHGVASEGRKWRDEASPTPAAHPRRSSLLPTLSGSEQIARGRRLPSPPMNGNCARPTFSTPVLRRVNAADTYLKQSPASRACGGFRRTSEDRRCVLPGHPADGVLPDTNPSSSQENTFVTINELGSSDQSRPTVVDVAFPVLGQEVPADHGFALFGALCRAFPTLHADPTVGIHPLRGTPAAGRRLLLGPTSTLRVRVPSDRVAALLPLARLGTSSGGVPRSRGCAARSSTRPVGNAPWPIGHHHQGVHRA
jgi:CRISPR-associated endoribonuclease Cas6